MALADDLHLIERRFWTGGPEAYLEFADAECLVVFGQMAQAMKREEIARTAEAGRWRDIEIIPKGFTQLAETVALITYECTAQMREGTHHHAHVSSAYVKRSDGWKLAFHQQTPVAKG